MKRDAAKGLAEGWRQWLLALTLCVFAFAYGAPTSLAVPISHTAMSSGCPKTGAPVARGASKGHAAGMSTCCIAHCLPAAPASLPMTVASRIAGGEERVRLDESGEGRSVPVPLPPPRSFDPA